MLYGDNPGRLLESFAGPDAPVGPGAYIVACKARGVTPSEEAMQQFQSHTGELRPGVTYYVLQFPDPAPVDMAQRDFVLAPYFSAILHDPTKSGYGYFILGQGITGGTTLRTVTAEGMNANLGAGPAPTLEGFLDTLRQRGQG